MIYSLRLVYHEQQTSLSMTIETNKLTVVFEGRFIRFLPGDV